MLIGPNKGETTQGFIERLQKALETSQLQVQEYRKVLSYIKGEATHLWEAKDAAKDALEGTIKK